MALCKQWKQKAAGLTRSVNKGNFPLQYEPSRGGVWWWWRQELASLLSSDVRGHQARAGPLGRTAAWSWQSVFAWRETKVPPVPITDYYSENFTTKTFLQPLGHSSSKLISGTPAPHSICWRSRSDQRSDGKSSQWKCMEDQCQLMITK